MQEAGGRHNPDIIFTQAGQTSAAKTVVQNRGMNIRNKQRQRKDLICTHRSNETQVRHVRETRIRNTKQNLTDRTSN